MKALRPWIAGYLVLCLALAGAVGLSPFLHQLIEHGGHGEWHTHHHSHSTKSLTFIPDGGQALPKLESMPVAETKSRPIFTRNHRPFKLPAVPLAKLISATADLLGGPVQNETGEDHEHHSLAQLLASGLLDQHVEISLLSYFDPSGSYCLLTPDELLLASIWNAQTPDRGPPTFAG